MRLLVSGSTATMRRLAPLYPDHLGHLLTPANGNKVSALLSTGLPWACDNGCFGGLDAEKFRRMLARIKGAAGCLWVVCPDVVADAVATVKRFAVWADEVRSAGHPLAFVGQDGICSAAVPWNEFSAWFVGGSDAWKLCWESVKLMHEAKERGKLIHVGRCNSLRRLQWAYDCGADSADGSSMSRFANVYVAKFARWCQSLEPQPLLWS